MKKKPKKEKKSSGLNCSCGGKLSYVAGQGLKCLRCGEKP